MENQDRLFTPDELCKYLKIPKGTLYKLTMDKRIPHMKIGRKLRFRESKIDAWADRLQVGG